MLLRVHPKHACMQCLNQCLFLFDLFNLTHCFWFRYCVQCQQ